MLIYDLVCDRDHHFEGWFRNLEDYAQQRETGLLCCPFCESREVQRIPSAAISTGTAAAATRLPDADPLTRLRELHRYVEQHFTDVGTSFCDEARKIHDGRAERRNIRGTATTEQFHELLDSGISVLPLPPKPVEKEKLN